MIYLDNAATSFPKPPCIEEAVVRFLRHQGANAGRSGHSLSIEAGRVIFEARESIATLIGLSDSSRLFFTSSATHGLNALLHGLLRQGDIVACSPLEHNSIMRPLHYLEKHRGIKIRIFPHDELGEIKLEALRESFQGARLVISTHASNVTGAILPIEEIAKIAHEAGALFLLDAAQSAGIVPINMEESRIDLLAASGHKGLLGLQGSGFFALAPWVDIDTIEPLMQGGTGSRSELEEQPMILPDKFECGTLGGHGIAAMRAGVEWINARGIEAIYRHEVELRETLKAALEEIKGARILATPPAYPTIANLSFIAERFSPSEIAQRLDREFGILTRASLHCAPSAHRLHGTLKSGAVRLSPGALTTTEEIEATIEALRRVLA